MYKNSLIYFDNAATTQMCIRDSNCLGYALGFAVGKVLKLDMSKCKAVAIEVGMQNSGLATSLAATHFAQYPLATIPGAVFSVWHNISGAIFANFMTSKE